MNTSFFNQRLRHVVLSALFFVSFAFFSPALAQNFEEGLKLYENEQFEEALQIFQSLESPQAILFTGKTYYSLGEYLKARSYLDAIPVNAAREIQLEGRYTSALADFHLNQFGSALNRLHDIIEIGDGSALINNANILYNGILDYLTLAQRRQAFQAANYTTVKLDLVESAFGKVDYQMATFLLEELRQSIPGDEEEAIANLEQELGSSATYVYRDALTNRLSAPRGMVYDIGAVLPKFSSNSPQFSVSQGLYQGYLLAAEQFNQRNADKKAFIRYQNTGADIDSAGYAMNYLAWSNNVDAVLGPLYSEPAMRVAELAEEYQIPVLAPLANADSLNIDNPYVFQANPTFSSHGQRMAEFAVKQLNMDTLAVFAEKNSLGASSAYAFRREAERLGAHIKHFFVEDLQTGGYDITEYTNQFGPDTLIRRQGDVSLNSGGGNINNRQEKTVIRNNLDGIYAPFTGQAAATLIDLLMIDLQVMQTDLTVLGSQEWGATEIPEDRIRNRAIYYTESFYSDPDSERVAQFREEFNQRFGQEANRYAMIGYDSADYLLKILEQIENPALLKDIIKTYPLYEGLINNINFNGTHVNQEVKVFEMTLEGNQPVVN
ncbi:MAG: ABC transporter substrate-binding protein [Balneolaceae bacterium]|nr:ABC transporter substrate-binding protein [Balneolaceae bacterium]